MEATKAMNYNHKIIVLNSKSNPIRIHTMLLREVLMAIGYNLNTAQKITLKTFIHYFKGKESLPEVLIEKEVFSEYLTEIHAKNKLLTVKRIHTYLYSIMKLRLKQQGVIILIGGASGSGKSSLTSLLAGRLLLKEMSSDNIRHIMRNFISKKESPFIFSSTYESDHLVDDPGLTQEQRTIEGYLRQCKEVQRELKNVLDYYHRNGVWVIVEGVHITPEFILDCMKSFNSCFGCIVYVEDAEKYKNRFASRSSKNSIKPEDNKYVRSFDKILMIQSYLIAQAEEKLIPRIHNTNLDTSYCLIHRSFLKNLKLIGKSKPLVDADSNKASMFHEEFLKTKELLSKAKKIKEYMKMCKFEKDEIAKVTDLRKKPNLENIDPDGKLTITRVLELEPITKDNKNMMVILPKIPGDGQIKALKSLIKGGKPEDPIKIHWVATDKRTVIFKTDSNHANELFLYDFVLEKDEIIERVITDPISREKIFSKALDSPQNKAPLPTPKSMKKPKMRQEGSDTSFESYKKAAKKRKDSMNQTFKFTDLKKHAADQEGGNELENSIDKLDSDSDSLHNEVPHIYLGL
jgi:2-phosphoglycerate kinase